MKANELLGVLIREPLGYVIVRQSGSHRILKAEGRRTIVFSAHPGATVAPGLVRKILVRDAGLSEEEALELL